ITTGNAYIASNGTASCPSGSKPLGLTRSGTATNALNSAPVPARATPKTLMAGTAFFALIAFGFSGLGKRRRLPTLLTIITFACLGLGLSGCGGSTTTRRWWWGRRRWRRPDHKPLHPHRHRYRHHYQFNYRKHHARFHPHRSVAGSTQTEPLPGRHSPSGASCVSGPWASGVCASLIAHAAAAT